MEQRVQVKNLKVGKKRGETWTFGGIDELFVENELHLENLIPFEYESTISIPSQGQSWTIPSISTSSSKGVKRKTPMTCTINKEIKKVTSAMKEIAQSILQIAMYGRHIWCIEENGIGRNDALGCSGLACGSF